MTTIVSGEKKLDLFEDEGFDLLSSQCRHLVYKPIATGSPLFNSVKQPNKVISINLTKEHFKEGSVKWSDLKQEPLNILSLWFNALAFAMDRKSRISTTPVEKKKRNEAQKKRKFTDALASETEGETEQSDAMQVEKESQFIGGREYLTVHIETLFEDDPSSINVFKVSGFRLWVFDGSSDKSGLDLLTKGIQEALLESFNAQRVQEERLQALNKAVGGTKKGPKPQWELAPEFQYTSIYEDGLFLNLVSSYCAKDDLLSPQSQSWQQRPLVDDNANANTSATTRFIDNNKFLSSNGINERIGRDNGNTMHTLFDKEQAMVYHVEYAKIRPEQRCMASYCGKDADEIIAALEQQKEGAKDPNRLLDMRTDAYADKEFSQYPFPSTTYRIDVMDLSQEKFFRLPLPHHIGSYLYSTHDREIVEKRIKEASSEVSEKPGRKKKKNIFASSKGKNKGGSPVDDGDMVIDDSSLRQQQQQHQPLGIHETTYEITIDLLNLHSEYLTEGMKSFIHTGASKVEANTRDNFLAIIQNDVQKRLKNIDTTMRARKDYFMEKVNGRMKNAPPQPSIRDFSPAGGNDKFWCHTPPHIARNSDKQHMLDRRVFAETGSDADAVIKEKNKHLGAANMAYFRQLIARWRSVDATIENAMACGGGLMYDSVFMGRNIYQILAVLNKSGYEKIDREFYDPRTKKVKKGRYAAYIATRRAFMEAITVEFYEEFRTSKLVSSANLGIRSDLFGNIDGGFNSKKKYVGTFIPETRFNIQARPYHFYKLWVYSYFTEHDGINHHYKTMDILFHARYHHCRSYPPGAKDPKLNVILSGQGTAGKSHRLQAMKDACPTGVSEGITHLTAQAFNVGQNMDDMLIINEEMSNKLISPGVGKGGTSEAANDDVRNNWKEMSTSGRTATLEFYFDPETGERKARLSKCSCQNVTIGATNNDLSDSDPNVMSRFLVISVPRSKNDFVGNRPQDKNKLEIGKDEGKCITMQEQVREVHRIYYMVECLINSGVMGGNTTYGVAIDGAQIYMTKILDLLQSKYGIATNDIRKRKHVLELARCMCISYAVWYGLTSPLTRHLFYDPYTGEYIGFNPRVLLDGILPYLVVTKDMIINSITSLSCLWGHEYMDKILEKITTSLCSLDKLRGSDFLRRPVSEITGVGINTTATTAFVANSATSYNSKKGGGRAPVRQGADDVRVPDDEMTTDFNYITIPSKSFPHIYELLSQTLGDLCVAPNDVSKILKDLSRTYIQTAAYEAEVSPTDPNEIIKLKKSTDEKRVIPRKIVDYGVKNGIHIIAISVAFLKQKLPHILTDDIIEDLTNFSYDRDLMDGDNPNKDKGGSNNGNNTNNMESEEDAHHRAIGEKLMDAITIRNGSVGESAAIKAIKDILENSILERNPKESLEQEKKNEEEYRDIFTGQVPWLVFPTSEHPQSLIIGSLFPDLQDKYSKTPGHNKEILLVDKISVIQLERKENGMPLVHYNYNTVSPSAQSCLSVFSVDEEVFPPLDPNETRPDIIREHKDIMDEIEAIQKENKRFAETNKNRFKMYAENPVFKIDRDLDFISCESHLRDIGYPIKRHRNRLVNYPPHTYMNLVDHRRSLKRPIQLVPLYADIARRIDTTRKIIEAQVGLLPEDTPTYYDLQNANIDEEDMEREESASLTQQHHAMVERRDLSHRTREWKNARNSQLFTNMRRYNVDNIVSASSNISRPTKKARVV